MVLGDLIHFFPSRLPYPRTWLSSIVVVYRGLLNSVFFSLFPFLSNPVIVVLVAVHTSIVFFSICTFPSVCRCVSVLCVYNVLYLFLFTLHRLAVLIFFFLFIPLPLSLVGVFKNFISVTFLFLYNSPLSSSLTSSSQSSFSRLYPFSPFSVVVSPNLFFCVSVPFIINAFYPPFFVLVNC